PCVVWWRPMVADPIFFRDLAFVLAAATVGGALAWLSRQPLILGYVLGGLLISPFTPGPAVSDVRTFQLFAEIGVVLLMFAIGIEFSLRDLARVRWIALLGGPAGIVLSIALAVGAGAALGWPPLQGVVVGMVISVASTMVLARLLLSRGELHSTHGRIMIGISLVEDLAVVVMIVVMPALGTFGADRLVALARGLGAALLVLVPFVYLAKKVVPQLFLSMARTREDDLFLLVALALGVGMAAFTQAVGLSLALGAFLAGLLVNESEYAHEALVRLLPLRDTFSAVFFVTIGALIEPRTLLANVPLLLVMVALVAGGKLVLRTLTVWMFGTPWRTALLAGVGLAQIGEFSFVLVVAARRAGYVGDDVYSATLAASLVSILVNAVLVRWAPVWTGRGGAAVPAPVPGRAGHVVVCGYGRIGSAVAGALETFEVAYVAIDNDPDVVRSLRARGVPCLFGDAAHRRLLEAASAGSAGLAVVALPQADRARLAVRNLRRLNPGLTILARTHSRTEHDVLRTAGATEVIQPELEAASTLIRHALRRLALDRDEVLAYLERFREAMEVGGAAGEAGAGPLPRLQEVRIGRGEVADRSLREARLRERFGITVVAVRRADGPAFLHPTPDTVLRAGDRVQVFGLDEQIAAFAAAAGEA
ncbi:MAG TPA: cation:proton antiporter, partial [Methylomirabilota bacterium]|nr:cation:proton antiporter [Methylomirabilota bacterium]